MTDESGNRSRRAKYLLTMVLIASGFIGLSLPYWTVARAASAPNAGVAGEAWNGLRFGLRYFASKLGLSYFAGTVSGTVFRDYDFDGVKDTNEIGIDGIVVTVTDNLGNTNTQTTAGGGLYTSTSLAGASARVEFTLPSGGSLDYLKAGSFGSGSPSSVQFVDISAGNAANVNAGFIHPSDFCETDPTQVKTITNCYIPYDNVSGANNGAEVLVSFPYQPTSSTSPAHGIESLANQIGTTYGLAYQRQTGTIFASPFIKRIAGLGPGTTGTIYRITPGGAADGTSFFDLNTLLGAGTAGANPHTSFTFGNSDGDFDNGAYAAVGKVAMGDLDIGEDDQTLWGVNLVDRKLYKMPIGTGPTAPTAGQISSFTVPSPCTGNQGDGRPFAVAAHNGMIYVGGVCTGQTGSTTVGASSDLRAYVYSFNPSSSTFSASPVLQFNLDYPRGCGDTGPPAYTLTCRTGRTGLLAEWRPWRDTLDTTYPAGGATFQFFSYPQPILTDITFYGNDMILGLRDRMGDQFGASDPGPQDNLSLKTVIPVGDVLRAAPNGAGGWTIESNADPDGAGGTAASAGANNEQGPGNGEFYFADRFVTGGGGGHDEIGLGGLAQIPRFDSFIMTVFDPTQLQEAGVKRLNHLDGSQVGTDYVVYDTAATNFGKASGLGDVEVLCAPAPIEIGNRIWMDTDSDGVQDPGEMGLSGVTVKLFNSANAEIGSVVTDANGNFIFSSAGGTDATGRDYNVAGLTRNTAGFQIRVDTTQGGALAGKFLTTANADATTNGDLRDSDGVTSGSNAVITFNTGGAGDNTHIYDIGFSSTPAAPPATIQLVKIAQGSNAAFNFTSADTDLDAVVLTTLGGTASSAVFSKAAGTYTVSEDALANWSFVSLSCTGDADNGSSINSNQVTIDLDAGENIVCTFTNKFNAGTAGGVMGMTPCATGGNDLGGTVFLDYNSNGTKDSTNEPGYGPITVTAYDNTNSAVATSFVNADGTYNFPGIFANFQHIRLEFTGLPAWAKPSFHGATAGSAVTVQKHTAGTCQANLAINDPGDYSQLNPEIVTPCYIFGPQSGKTDVVLLNFPYTAGSNSNVPTDHDVPSAHVPIALQAQQVGTTWGVDYARSTRRVYAGAYFKKHTGFGPGADTSFNTSDDAGAIYVINRDTGAITNRFTVPNATTNSHNTADYFNDNGNTGWDAVGKTSLGGLALSDDDSRLFVMNLENRTLYALNAATGAALAWQTVPGVTAISGSAPSGSAPPLPSPANSCPAGDIRPFAVSYYHGSVYVGMVCSGESTVTAGNPAGDRSYLQAYLYTVDPATLAFSAAPVFSMALNYPRVKVGEDTGWQPWKSGFALVNNAHPQPIFAGIAFDRGDLIVGLRDRAGDQAGWILPSDPANPSDLKSVYPAGDTLRACGGAGSWTLESNARCGSKGTGPQNTGAGPGFGEFYYDDSYGIYSQIPIIIYGGHTQLSMGAVLQVPGSADLLASIWDPYPYTNPFEAYDGGFRWFNNDTGGYKKSYRLYNGDGNPTSTYFGKANGLGGLTSLVELPPLEIGNYIWRDTDMDGVQDPCESGISGLTVELWKSGVKIAQTTTDANGEYYFSNNTVVSQTWTAPATGLLPNMAYEVRIPLAQAPLQGSNLSILDYNANTGNGDMHDSDGLLSGDQSAAVISLTTGDWGCNDHTFDQGFTPVFALGNRVWKDLNNNGLLDAGDGASPGIDNVVLRLLNAATLTQATDGSGALVADQTTAGGGYYRFDNLMPGDYVVEVRASNFSASGVLSDCVSSAIDAGDPDVDQDDGDDNGIGVIPGANGVRGAVVTLGPAGGSEPVNDNDPPTNPLPGETVNDNSNRTVDFGFISVVSIGNQVFYDTNNNGLKDGADNGINGVVVELFADADMNGQPDTAFPLDRKTTATVGASAGLYLFTEQTLDTTTGAALGSPMKLTPGKYVICLPASNFNVGQPLNGLFSSGTTAGVTGATTETAAPDANLNGPGSPSNPGIDNDDNGTLATAGPQAGRVLSGTLDVQGNEPLAENPDNDAVTADPLENLTVDFGFYSLSIGNLVFSDNGAGALYNNGLFDGGETGLAAVTVRLYAEDGTTLLMTKQTDANGKYLFPALAAGKYYVEVDRTSAALTGMTSSKDPANASNPNGADSDDNGVLATMTTTAVRSVQLMLVPGDPTVTGEADQGDSDSPGFGNPVMTDNAATPDANSDLEVDFGFVRVYSLGNLVWRDWDNSGTVSAGDGGAPGIDGVVLRLLDGAAAAAVDINGASVANQTTAGGGYYRFDNLPRGDFIVEVTAANFASAAVLDGHISSTPDAGDPDTDVDDRDDNGVGTTFHATNGIRSQAVTLGEGTGALEPTSDNDPLPNPAATLESVNNQSNRTVDFGFARYYSLGNRVFRDLDNDGCISAGDGANPGIDGVVVRLLDVNGNPVNDVFGNPIATKTTAGNGYFRFDNLPGTNFGDPNAGQYIVEILASNFSGALAGMASSGGGAGAPFEPAPDPDNDLDDKDDGTHTGTPALSSVRSLPVTLGEPGGTAEPTTDNDAAPNPDTAGGEAPNNQSNRTVDFGFTPYWSLGNRVWKDLDNSGTINNSEQGINLVKVVLLNGAGLPARNIYDQPIPNALTQNGGYYRFDMLSPGDYIVEIPADEFLAGKALFAHNSSTGAPNSATGPYENPAPDPDNPGTPPGGIDSDDNGNRQPSGAVRSLPIALGPFGTPEFLNELDRQIPNPAGESADDRANLTLDFGFVPGLSLGNIVWKDLNDDGIRQTTEPTLPGVVLELYADTNNNNQLDVGAGDTLLGTSTTTFNGVYGFMGLIPGNYFVRVAPSNFAANGALFGCASSSVDDPTPNNDQDDDDNGVQNATPQTNGIASGLITLSVGDEPDGDPATDGDPDPNTNLTIDFGFTSTGLSLGNLVWKDLNNNGQVDASEPGVPGVLLRLYKDANNNTTFEPGTDLEVAGISPQTTNGLGNYQFSGLLAGTYYVQVDPSNFAGAGALVGCASSTVTDGNANNDEDNDDNGSDAPAVISSFVVLQSGAEPDLPQDGDNTNGNLTVDFGFYAPLSIGNLVWKDYDNDGLYEPGAGETGVNGVLIELYRENNGTPGLQIPGDAFVTSQMTAGSGGYNFSGLLPGDYYVFLPASNFGGALAGCVTSTPTQLDPNLPAIFGGTDNDDNGSPGPNGGIVTGAITLVSRTEPVNDGDTDPNTNLTIDFGFYSPVNLGNLVWKDYNNNGVFDPATEAGLNGVVVELFRDNGNGVFDLPSDVSLGTQTTAGGGFYNFTNLAPGAYFVRVNAVNFQTNGALVGCISSTPTTSDPNAPANPGGTDSDDNGVDDQNPPLNGIRSNALTLTGNAEPPVGTDTDGPNGNLTLDFGFYPQLNLGNLVWKDYDNDGVKDATEPGIAGVRLDLYKDTGDHSFSQATDTLVAQQVSDNNGNYNFTGLVPGDYFVRVSAVNFAANGALFGCNSSTPASQDPDLPANVGGTDNDDNGVNDVNPTANGIISGEITLSGNTEPDSPVDGDGKNGNQTLDFGFYTPLNLGNRVWKDLNNNGLLDAGEPGVDSVVVQLYSDDGDTPGVFDALDSAVGAPQATAGGGFYNFTNLTPGAYLVRVMPVSFQTGGALAGCLSSSVTDAVTDNNEDNDDNGVDNPTPGANGITSSVVNLLGNDEPTNDGDGPNGNLTVDFGFYAPVSLGNLVWKDYDNDGFRDAGEPGVQNVSVELWRETNGTPGLQTTGGTPDTLIASQPGGTTDANGNWSYTNLLPGDYYARIPNGEFLAGGDLFGCQSSTPNDSTPNNNEDNDDNGLENGDPAVNGIVTNAITLTGGQEPPPPLDGNDTNGNNTLDFGFYSPVNLGNRVWKDLDNSGTVNAADGPNPGVDNVTVELYRDNGNGSFDGGDTLVTTTTTAGGGFYNFSNLSPGSYLVKIPAAEFAAGGDLANCQSSTPSDPTPNNNEDHDDNGVDNPTPQTNGIATNAVTLLGNDEPDTPADGDGKNGNLTLDLGFYPPMNLGNIVWKDLDNDGLYEPPTETGVDGVVVELFKDTNNNNTFDPATDQKLSETTTSSGGLYNFTGLIPATYFTRVAPLNFAQGAVLEGCRSSAGADTGDSVDNNDNGVDGGTPTANGVPSNPIQLIGNSEPTNDGDGPNGNLTVDFGLFAPVNLGNRVWKDHNNDGLLGLNEPGVDGVLVELFRDANNNDTFDDALTTTQLTSGGGYYNFTNLTPGKYFVRVAASNFTGSGALAGCLSSEPTIADPNQVNGGTDNDDNGVNDAAPETNGIRSNSIDLLGGAEPTNDGDGRNGNLTLDFGFIPQMSLGNLVWKDLNNDGLYQLGEPGVPNVTVNLYRETGVQAGLQLTGPNADTPAGTMTTASSGVVGRYQFTGLAPAVYYVAIPAAEFATGGDLHLCLSSEPDDPTPDNDQDNDDNGNNTPTPETNGVSTGAITLVGNSEPNTPADSDGPNGNQTVDLGFIPRMNLGNVVWKDNNNDGLVNNGEPGVNGVTVELIRDANNNNQPDDAVYRTTVTATVSGQAGAYNFADLPPGNYFVRVPAAEFAAGGDLAGCLSSTVTTADPNNPNGGTDNDDNGLDNPTPQTNGVTTGLVSLVGNSEPTNDGDGPNGNLTIDLGFYPPMNLGNRVWKDLNNDGLLNNGEPGVANVTVELWRETNGNTTLDLAGTPPDTMVTSLLTNGNGEYNFVNLTPGTYYVRVSPQEFQANGDLADCVSSTTTTANPNADVDNDDNGVDAPAPQTTGIASNAVVLAGGAEPTTDGDGPNGNLTVDFGFYAPLSIGNLVWKDNDNDGVRDTSPLEPGVANVRLELFRDNGNGIFDPAADSQIGFTTTNTNGEYRFDNLTPGAYFVLVAQSNFTGSGALAGCLSSTTTAPDPNDPSNIGGVDHNDDGVDSLAPQTTGIVTKPINLSGGAEPNAPVDGDGPNSNLTIDFGFYPPMSLGNLVWKDTNNNGVKDASEAGVANVLVELWRDNGNGTFDPGTDTQVTPNQTTNASGNYQFTNLLPGGYFVRVAASNFTGSGALAGCSPSTSANPNPNDDKDNDNNATTTPNGVVTGLITLTGNSEPPQQTDGDGPNGNQTVDLGFTTGSMTLGNLVWKDVNSNGLREANEPGVPNVALTLYRDANGNQTFEKGTDTLVAGTTTNASGVYAFTGLTPADYFVEVNASNFDANGALAGCVSTLGSEPPNNDADNDDNGSNSANPSANPPVTSVISLVQNGEPDNDGDGKNGNLTVDFGFVNALTVKVKDPVDCTGAGTVLEVTAEMLNVSGATQPNNAGPEMLIVLPATLSAVAGSAASQGGNGAATIVGPQRIEWNGSMAAGERVIVTYKVQVANSVQSGVQLCIPTTANFDTDLNGTNEAAMTIVTCFTADCQPIGPGIQVNPGYSVLVYPIYTSSPSNPNTQNTRINITNVNTASSQPVHMFFVDGATCSISDSYLCLTANQTTSFVMSDLDPGVTGYAIAVAVNETGCPVAANFLLGDEYVKFESGHAANLKADCITALPGGLPACQVGSSTAVLSFDGVSYSQLPRVVAVSNIADRASGNDPMLILNRISGNAATGMDRLGSIFGVLYDDAESAFSFSFTPSSCQFRSVLSNNFPRTTPRFEQVVAAGRSGWMRLWSQSEAPITGVLINRNPNASSSSQAYNQGHSLHTLTTSSAGSITIPVFPPSC